MIDIKDVLFLDTLSEEKVKTQSYIDEYGCSILSTLVDGHHGRYVPYMFLEMMGEHWNEDDEFIHERTLEVLEQATGALGNAMKDDEYRIDYHPDDGSICIFYGQCKEDF